MKRIAFIYPFMTSYILPVFYGVAESGRVQLDVIYGLPPSGDGFGEHLPFEHPNVRWIQVEEKQSFCNRWGMYQKGILSYLMRMRPDAVLIWANPRYLSFWGVLLLGRLLGIPVYPRGHGLVKYPRAGVFKKWMYKVIVSLSRRYVCYTPKVKESLTSLIKNSAKLAVDYNTLYNAHPVPPGQKNGKENGIFFIGRIRPGCGVDVLISIVDRLRRDRLDMELHIIGDGPLKSMLEEKASEFPWLHYYGGLFNQKQISDISRACRFGCGPGFMGLNVVHMLSLSLPVVTHAEMAEHMGPEPEYVRHGENGWILERTNDGTCLMNALRQLWNISKERLSDMQEKAFSTYQDLGEPPYHERLLRIIDER